MSVPVPANVDIDDTIMFGLTARHLAVMAPMGAALLALWQWLDDIAPLWVTAAVCLPPAVATVVVMLARRDGTTADRLLLAALRQPRRRLAPGTPQAHASLRPAAGPATAAPASLYGPVKSITAEGVVDLGPRGCAVAYDATCINLDLRSDAEQEALVIGFARVVRGLAASVQIVVSTQPVDLSGHAAAISADTAQAPEAVRAAAADHAAWLHHLTTDQVLMRRQVTLLLRADDDTVAQRAGDHITAAAAGFGVAVTRLDHAEVTARIRHCLDPYLTDHRSPQCP